MLTGLLKRERERIEKLEYRGHSSAFPPLLQGTGRILYRVVEADRGEPQMGLTEIQMSGSRISRGWGRR